MQTKQILINEKLQLKKNAARLLSHFNQAAAAEHNFSLRRDAETKKRGEKNAIKMLPSKCIKNNAQIQTHIY